MFLNTSYRSARIAADLFLASLRSLSESAAKQGEVKTMMHTKQDKTSRFPDIVVFNTDPRARFYQVVYTRKRKYRKGQRLDSGLYSSRAAMASNRNLLIVLPLILLSSTFSRAKYEPAGCSDEGCGIPCYMRPVEDPCHYQPHSPCNEEGSTDLEQWVENLNSSLHRLENKLIQKGVSKLNCSF